jgi:hypothetical protein
MVQALHYLIDQLAGIFLPLLSKVKIDHGGFELGMAHVTLDDPQVHASFEKMGGIGMTQGMNRDSLFVNSGSNLGATEGALNTAFGHGQRGVFRSTAASAKSREQEAGVAVSGPIAAEQQEGRLGERDVAILGALSTMDMDHHAGGIDIGDFEVEAFVEPQAAGIDGGQIGVILEGMDLGKNTSDFLTAENGRKASFGLGSEDSEDVPVSLEDVFKEEANAAIADAHGIGRPVIDVLSPEEIVLEFLLGDQIGIFAIELSEHSNGAGVGLLSPLPLAVELKSLDRFVIPLCLHDTSPFSVTRDFPFHWGGVWRYHT